MEHRPDGATTQEVYNMAQNVFNLQTSMRGANCMAGANSHPTDEDKCLQKKPDTAQDDEAGFSSDSAG